MFVIDLKDRTVAEFSQQELNLFYYSKIINKPYYDDRFVLAKDKKTAVKVIKKLMKKKSNV